MSLTAFPRFLSSLLTGRAINTGGFEGSRGRVTRHPVDVCLKKLRLGFPDVTHKPRPREIRTLFCEDINIRTFEQDMFKVKLSVMFSTLQQWSAMLKPSTPAHTSAILTER